MLPWLTDAVLVALITGALGIIAGRISSSGSVRAAKVQAAACEREAMTAPYEALASRVSQLEIETASQRETIDAQHTEIVGLRVEMGGLRAARAEDVRALVSRDSCWQGAWDALRENWLERRTVVDPPPYPVGKLDVKNVISGGAL